MSKPPTADTPPLRNHQLHKPKEKHMKKLTAREAAAALDAIDAADPETAHPAADEILLASVPADVAAAYNRVATRAAWWAFA